MAYDHVVYEVKDGVATITLNRPEAYNALNVALAFTEKNDAPAN